jgi:hypothetical protein
MDLYERAATLAAANNPDPSLRWNSCVRTIEGHKLEPRTEHAEFHLE